MSFYDTITKQLDGGFRPASASNSTKSQNSQRQNQPTICGLSIWTDPKPDGVADTRTCRRFAPLPKGLLGSPCTNCGNCGSLTGALITPTADEKDPNILCLSCGYWRD